MVLSKADGNQGRVGDVRGFVSARGSAIVNGDGREILLRGVGLGNWLLPEGYMWRFPAAADRPRRIERLIRDLVGETKAAEFWEAFYDRYISEADVQQISREGFNSVRLPLNSRYLLGNDGPGILHEKRMQRIDRFIHLCRAHRLYVILDLHGAPGGQTGTNIDDSEHDKPELFLSEENAELTIEIWRALANRYRDEWIVAGYDLLNEPLPNWFAEHNSKVLPLYRRIVEAIRELDSRHMIILEGVHWASDWSVLTRRIDPNLMLQFHKYWNNPDRESLKPYLQKRDEWNVPIFMGEGGENNTDWYSGAFRLFEDLRISWNFWTWKKMDTNNSPVSIRSPGDWDTLIGYADGGPKPDRASAERILWEYLDNLKMDRCDYRTPVVRSLFRRPPLRIPAIFFAFQDRGIGYDTEKPVSSEVDFRREDRMPMEFDGDGTDEPNFAHASGEQWTEREWMRVRLEPNSWVAYDFDLTGSGVRDSLEVRLSGSLDNGNPDSARVSISLDDPDQEESIVWRPGDSDRRVTFRVLPRSHRIRIGVGSGTLHLKALTLGAGS